MKRHHERVKQRQVEAKERDAAYARLTPKQKIDRLDQKLGKGVGAKKQRERLASQLKSQKSEKKAEKQ